MYKTNIKKNSRIADKKNFKDHFFVFDPPPPSLLSLNYFKISKHCNFLLKIIRENQSA